MVPLNTEVYHRELGSERLETEHVITSRPVFNCKSLVIKWVCSWSSCFHQSASFYYTDVYVWGLIQSVSLPIQGLIAKSTFLRLHWRWPLTLPSSVVLLHHRLRCDWHWCNLQVTRSTQSTTQSQVFNQIYHAGLVLKSEYWQVVSTTASHSQWSQWQCITMVIGS